MSDTNPTQIHATGEATGFIPAPGDKGKPITVIGTNSIRAGFDATCLQQALNARSAPGVTDLVLNPDAHAGYGAPVGCVLTSPTHVYPGPVGVDIKCSMSFLQLDLPADQVADKMVRRALIDAILERTPTGPGRGQRSARKARKVGEALGVKVATDGASPEVLHALGIPLGWAERCEDAVHVGHDGTNSALAARLEWVRAHQFSNFLEKITQLGSYGGGNHFGECEVVRLLENDRAQLTAKVFGLRDGCVGFLSHCGSRGFGHALASGQFRALQQKFAAWEIPLPGDDKELVYAPLGTPEADAYLDDMALGANFATVNHLLINALVLEAFQEIIPGVKGSLVYFISHNIARKELLPDGRGGFAGEGWVHRKGATRAFVRLRAHMDSGVRVPDLADTERPVTESNCAGATPPGGEQLEVNEQSVTGLETQRQVNSIRSAVLASLRAKWRSPNKIERPAQREWNASGREPLMVGDGMFGSPCDVNQGTTAGGERAGRGQSPRSSWEAGNDRGAKGDRDMVFDEVDRPTHEGPGSAARLCARLRWKTGLGNQRRTDSGPPAKQVSGAQACAAGATLPKALSRVPEPVHQDHELESRMRENRLSGLGGGRRHQAVLYPHPAGHPSLKGTPFATTGHPILLPGNPTAGSVIMTADAGAEKSAYSVNHGAGRCMGRKAADRALDQKTVDDEFTAHDILSNCRQYPKDEAPAAYKDFDAVLDSVKKAGLASEVARLKARFVIKDSDTSLRGAA